MVLLLSGCSPDDSTSLQEKEFAQLQETKKGIEQLSASGICVENSECKVIAFGSKPCGGPWTYLAYSTAIDEASFLELVANYNAAEHVYNTKWGIVSDCMAVGPPTAVECIDGKCTPVYN